MTDPAAAPAEQPARRTFRERLLRHPAARIGPGIITGVADDDPSGIATYSQAGAQFGLDLLWTMPLTFPLMTAVQSLCARIGRVTGAGLAYNLQRFFPRWLTVGAVLLLLAANIFNIAADVAMMGEVTALSVGGNRHLATAVIVVLSLLLQVFVPYHRYVKGLRWLTLSLLAYVGVLFTVHVPWLEVLHRTFLPRLQLDAATAVVVVGVLGTTISPYLFFWQCSEEIEDMRLRNAPALKEDPTHAAGELRRIRWDTGVGMFYSNLIGYFVILTTGLTLHEHGIRDIQTAAQAATALRPLAGEFAFYLFSLGILGVGLIGVPVLAGSAAYALAEALGWRWGLERQARGALRFYGVIAGSMAAGFGLGFTSIRPVKALFYSAVINGVVAVPLLVLILLLASRTAVMGAHRPGWGTLALGWVTVGIVALAAVAMFIPAPH
ncbi:MAG: divalent metal cation transporter [Proteobacteria bacterium]|nr:divalent metal cation transporter [Pseudomonadota bacterium]